MPTLDAYLRGTGVNESICRAVLALSGFYLSTPASASVIERFEAFAFSYHESRVFAAPAYRGV